MSTLRGWFLDEKKGLPAEFGLSHTTGTSLTIPGQGSDLAVIIQSIVKLPPIQEREYTEDELRLMQLDAEVETMYAPERVALAEEAQERQKSRKLQKQEAQKDAEKEHRDDEKDVK